jgi:hypothetical protein
LRKPSATHSGRIHSHTLCEANADLRITLPASLGKQFGSVQTESMKLVMVEVGIAD